MTDNNLFLEKLVQLGLSPDEATIYLKLLKAGTSTHLRLSRETGITRSKVYRLVESLEQQGLVSRYIDDTGRFITPSEPENLTIRLAIQEAQLKERRDVLRSVVPQLARLTGVRGNKFFSIRAYEGVDGFRQMLWHELKTKGEMLVLGGATIEELAPNPRWAERHRAGTITAGYYIRELLNEARWDLDFTKHSAFAEVYGQRHIDKETLDLTTQIVIYNDTVSTYHWRHDQKVGFEVISKEYANTLRQVFEFYWRMARPAASEDLVTA